MVSKDPSIAERVWQVVAAIPCGRVSTYGEVAIAAGLPRGARRVGRILGQLPPGSTLPWHRVINARGQLSLPPGSDGYFEQIERLQSEGVALENGRVDLRRFSTTTTARV